MLIHKIKFVDKNYWLKSLKPTNQMPVKVPEDFKPMKKKHGSLTLSTSIIYIPMFPPSLFKVAI